MKLSAILAATAFGFGLTTAAQAAVVTHYVGADVSAAPYTFDLGTGSLTFGVDGGGFFADSTVQTGGTAQVLSLGAPFYVTPTPTTFFTDRGGSIGPDSLGVFAAYATPTDIPFSATESLVGFDFQLADGLHYGYAEVAGSSVTGFRFETTARTGVALGEIAPVPEPSVWAMLIAGFGLTGTALRRRPRSLAII